MRLMTNNWATLILAVTWLDSPSGRTNPVPGPCAHNHGHDCKVFAFAV